MSQLTVQEMSKSTPITPSFQAAASGGDTFLNNGKVFAYIKNGHVSATRTVTFNSKTNCNQGHDHDISVVVPASGEKMLGFFETNRFNANGLTEMTYDDEADVTIALVKAK